MTNIQYLINKLDDEFCDLLEEGEGELLNRLFDKLEELQETYCEMVGHEWAFDQCGYWQHKSCINCLRAKYPELARKRCSELEKEMRDITEEEYEKKGGFDLSVDAV